MYSILKERQILQLYQEALPQGRSGDFSIIGGTSTPRYIGEQSWGHWQYFDLSGDTLKAQSSTVLTQRFNNRWFTCPKLSRPARQESLRPISLCLQWAS